MYNERDGREREIQHERERGGRERDTMRERDSERGRGTDRQTDRCTNDIRYAILSL